MVVSGFSMIFHDFPRSRRQEWFSGVVARTAPFGAFVTVTLEDGATADGLVHVSKIKDRQQKWRGQERGTKGL